MPRLNIQALSEARLAEAVNRSESRFTDLRFDVRHVYEERGELVWGRHLFAVGGVWDRRLKRYDPKLKPSKSRWLGIQDGQLEAAAWFKEWLIAFAAGDTIGNDDTEDVWAALFGGGRRGGKTNLGVTATAILSIAVPDSWCWVVSESISKSWECHQTLTAALPKAWYTDRGAPWYEYSVLNRSMIWQKSGHNPEALKQGAVDLACLNEGQKLAERCYLNCRGAIADTGGIVIACANPPDTAKGQWVLDMHDDIEAGTRKAKYFHFDFNKNPFIKSKALTDLAEETDDRTLRMEVFGEFLPSSDVVFYNWSRKHNETDMPELGDITAEFLAKKRFTGGKRLLGMDFQLHPYMAVVSLRFFKCPYPKCSIPLIWSDWALAVDGNEKALSAELYAHDFDPAETIIIADASGRWQGAERIKGKGSFDLLKQEGWQYIYKPDSKMDKNPLVTERVKATLALIKSAGVDPKTKKPDSKLGHRHLFSVKENTELNRAVRSWETRSNVPYRNSEHAHFCDALTYPLWRLFPRRRKPGKKEMRAVKRPSRLGKRQKGRMKGF